MTVTINLNTTGSALGAFACIAVSIAMPAPAVAQTDTEDKSEIVVTARKREERLLSTPIAITAMTTAEIGRRGVVTLSDLVEATPGVNISGNSAGRNDRSFQQISTRGFTPSTTDSTLTASFIDGVPVTSPTALNAVADPARVEVLKGPQNAYFGRNAFVGAVNVVTKLPGSTFGGDVSASAYSREGYDIQASLNGPIAGDVLGFRIAGRSFKRGGSYRNAADPSERLGDQQTRLGNLLLVLKPSASLMVKAFGLYSEDHDGPAAQGMLSAYELRANNGAVNIPALSGSSAGSIVVPSLSNCRINNNPFICGALPALPKGFSPAQNTAANPSTTAALANGAFRPLSPEDGVQGYGLKRVYMHAHLTMDYDIGETGLTLSSLTGYNHERFSQLQDFDNYDSSRFANAAATAANGLSPFWNFPFGTERVNDDFSQEGRLAYDKGGPLTAMIGANYLWAKNKRDQLNIQSEVLVPNAVRNANTYSPPYQVRTQAVFGSVNYDVFSRLSVSLEGRYQRERIYAFSSGGGAVISPIAAAELGIPAGAVPPLTAFTSRDFKNFMPRVILNYKATPDVIVYGSWSQAANVSIASFNTRLFSGTAGEIAQLQALNVPAVTKPEKLTNYELGTKGRLLGGRLTYALAAFAAEWTDQYNLRTITFLDTSVTPNRSSNVFGVANSGRTLVKGLELDLTAKPVDGVSLTFAGAFIDTNVREFSDPNTERLTGITGTGFRGNHLPLTSRYSFTVSPQFSGDMVGRDDATWFIRADASYKSRQFVDYSNITWVRGRTVVNGRVGVTLGDVSLELFARNLLNDRGYVSATPNNLFEPSFALASRPFAYVVAGLPELRTVGVKTAVKF